MADSWTWSEGSKMKLCFVTTGATAPFTDLIRSVLQLSSIDALRAAGYTHLLVQYGVAKDVFDSFVLDARSHVQAEPGKGELVVGGMGFKQEGLREEFLLVQQSRGLVISHAGSGSILEALRYGVPLVVVPNTELLDNHQVDLAVAMERSKYLICGDLNDLAAAIYKAEDFRRKMAQFPPITSGKHRETKSFAAIMDETLGILE